MSSEGLDCVVSSGERLAPGATTGLDAGTTPEHTVKLPGGEWSLWRHFVLRGTGFPASLIDRLGADEAAAAADRHFAAVCEVQRCRAAAINEVSQGLETTDAAARRAVWAQRRRIFKGAPAADGGEQEQLLLRALEAGRAASAAYAAAFGRAMATAIEQIKRTVSEPRFREAMLWQNHQAVRRVETNLATRRGTAFRRATELVAMQMQRYSVKNDSIGFFGPIGWGRVSDESLTVDVRPGPALVDRREVYFEGWCIDTLAERLGGNPALAPWTSPRVATGVWLDRDRVYVPQRGAVEVTPLQRRVLDLCDGWRTASAIAALLAAHPGSGVASPHEILDVLRELVAQRLIVWRLEVTPQLHPERELAMRVAAIGDPELQAACVAAVRELIDARERVACAAGQPEALASALEELDATFVRLTGCEPTRRPGQMYAGRGLVYEDCRRDCQVTLGREFLDRIGPPLSLMLDGARWAAGELALAVRCQMRHTHAEMRARDGVKPVDGHAFFERVKRSAPAALGPAVHDIRRRLQTAWQTVLRIDYDARRMTCDLDDVVPRARDLFRCRGRLWSRAQYISPDIMVAAASPAALRRGEFECVLGEVHTTNSLLWSPFVSQHPDPQWVADALDRDAAKRAMVFSQIQKDAWLARTALSAYATTAWQYQWGDLPPRYSCRPAPAGMFVAIDAGGTVVMRARDGGLEFDALDLFGTSIGTEANEIIKRWLPDVPHVPRIAIGGLTAARERWLTRPADMPFLYERDRERQFAAIRAWARERQMPRRVFYKSPAERKPCLLDFNSPMLVALFVRFMKQLGEDTRVPIEEMLPDLSDAWLVDAHGARYTCELRLAALLARDPERATGQ